MAEEETTPNIDWGEATSRDLLQHFTLFTTDKHDILRLEITVKDGRILNLFATRNAVIGIEKVCADTRKTLGF
jgi:hypothetical protein